MKVNNQKFLNCTDIIRKIDSLFIDQYRLPILCSLLLPLSIQMNTTKNKLTLKNQLSSVITIDPEFLKTCIIPRSLDSKKGDNGTVLIVGGNRIYHGAPILASLSALRSGTDLVYTAVPRSNIIPVRSSSPNIIALPLADDKLTVGSANRLVAMLPKKPEAAP